MSPKSIKFLENSNIKMSFTGKMITSYGGFSLLAKLFEKIELHENLEKIFPVVEISPNSRGVKLYQLPLLPLVDRIHLEIMVL